MHTWLMKYSYHIQIDGNDKQTQKRLEGGRTATIL